MMMVEGGEQRRFEGEKMMVQNDGSLLVLICLNYDSLSIVSPSGEKIGGGGNEAFNALNEAQSNVFLLGCYEVQFVGSEKM